MNKLLLALALALAPTLAFGACNGVFPPNTICGNNTGANGIPNPVAPSSFTNVAGGTNGQIQYNNSGALGGFTASGDATINTTTGAVNVTKSGGVAFGSLAFESVVTYAQLPYTVTAKTANYTAVTGDCGNLLNLGGNAQFTLTINAVGSYPSNCYIKLQNVDVYTGVSSGRGKLISVNGLANFWLMPKQSVTLNSDGTAWQPDKQITIPDPSISIGYIGRWFLTASTEIFVGGTSPSDTANDGLAVGSGLATIAHGMLTSCNAIDMQFRTYTLQIADATWTVPVQLCNMTGYSTQGGHSELVISGSLSGSVPTGNTIISTTANNFSSVGLYTPWRIQGFKMTSASGSCIQGDGHSFIYVGNNIFNGCAVSVMQASFYSFVEAVDVFSVTAGGGSVLAAVYSSLVDAAITTITVTGTPAFSQGFAVAIDNSVIQTQSTTITGSATGTRFSTTNGAAIDTGTANVNYFPGNVAGSTNCATTSTSIGACGYYN